MRTMQAAAFFSSLVFATPIFAALVAAYGLNAQSGTTATDASGTSNTGTMNNTTRVTGQFGSARSFPSGANAYIDVGNGATLQITGSMTVSAWIKASSFPAEDAPVVSKRNLSGGYQLDVTKDTGPRTIGFKLTTPAGASMIRYGATALSPGQWYHVAGVYNAASQTMDVYLNGAPDNGTLSGTITSSQKDLATNVFLGRRSSGNDFFLGTIDEVRIYNSALTQGQIQADMNTSVETLAPDTTAPTVPGSFFATAMGTSTIKATWTASDDYYGVTFYKVERCQGAGCSSFAEVGSVTDSPFSDTGLSPGATYRYRVRATDAAGNLSGYSSVSTATTLSAPPSGGRVGVYPFEEGSGGTTADLSDVHNVGTVNGATWTTAGKFGKALVFGPSQYVDLGNPGMFQLTGSMTVSAWIYSSSFPSDDAAIVSKRDASTMGYQLDTTIDIGPRTLGFKLTTGAGDTMARYGASTLQANTWYHVAGVYDAQAQTLNVYLNGVLDNGPSLGTVTGSQRDTQVNVNIGRKPSALGYEFIGTIDEVRIYNRVLSQAEIQTDMNTAAGGGSGDTTPPTAPSGLGATAAGSSQINLSWTASTDNVGVTGYLVERCQGAGCGNFAQIGTPALTTFNDTGLVAATSYSYRVRATDAAGNLSGYSNVASATTGAAQAQVYFIQTDHLNTPRMIANASGTKVWTWDQREPFGNDVPNDNPSGLGAFDFPLRFPGQYFDKETALHYNMMRDYDPGIGTYTESDPIGLKGGLNTYAYIDGNPLIQTDFAGLLTKPGAGTVGGLGGKAAGGLSNRILEWLSQPGLAGENAASSLCKLTQGRTPYNLNDLCTTECLSQAIKFRFTWLPGWLPTCTNSCVDFFPKCNKKPNACLPDGGGTT